MHAKCLIHRDLKPGNIMVRMEEGAGCSVKIIDFGMARQVSFGTGEMTNEIGSLQYRAP